MLKTIKKDYWRYTLNKTIYRCMNNDYAPKNGDFFFEKTMKRYFKPCDVITNDLWNHTNIQRSNREWGWGWGGGRGVLDILIVFIVFWRGHLSILKTMKCRNFRNITVNSLDAKRWICGCIHGKLVVYSSKVWSQNEIYSQCFGHSEQVKFVDLKYNIWKLRILAGRWTDLVTKLQNYIYEIWYLVEIEHANYEYGTWNWWPWPKIIGSSKFCLSNEICSNFYELLHSQQMEHANNIGRVIISSEWL